MEEGFSKLSESSGIYSIKGAKRKNRMKMSEDTQETPWRKREKGAENVLNLQKGNIHLDPESPKSTTEEDIYKEI